MRRLLQEERALLDNEASGPAVVEALAEQQRISDSAELEWQTVGFPVHRIEVVILLVSAPPPHPPTPTLAAHRAPGWRLCTL